MTNDKKLENKTKSKISLMVATPCYDTVQLHYTKSILDLQKECLLNNYYITFQILKSSLVTQGRNLSVSAFLNSKCTHFLFIDSDISLNQDTIYAISDLTWGSSTSIDLHGIPRVFIIEEDIEFYTNSWALLIGINEYQF